MSNTDHIAGIALRFLIVAALTSLGVALCLAIASLSYRDLNEFQRQPLRLASEWVFAAGICFPFVVVGGLLFGVPVHILLRRREIAGLWPYALAGVVVGALAGGVMLGVLLDPVVAPRAALLGAIAGLLASCLWWKLQVAGHRGV